MDIHDLVQAYVPGAALKGTTAVSPLTTPRAMVDPFDSHDFQEWMGVASQPQIDVEVNSFLVE